MLSDYIHKFDKCEVRHFLLNALLSFENYQQTKMHENLSICVNFAFSFRFLVETSLISIVYDLVVKSS